MTKAMAAAAVSKKRQRADDVATPKSAAESATAAAATTPLEDLQDFDFKEGERQRSIRMIVEGLLTQKEKLTDVFFTTECLKTTSNF